MNRNMKSFDELRSIRGQVNIKNSFFTGEITHFWMAKKSGLISLTDERFKDMRVFFHIEKFKRASHNHVAIGREVYFSMTHSGSTASNSSNEFFTPYKAIDCVLIYNGNSLVTVDDLVDKY